MRRGFFRVMRYVVPALGGGCAYSAAMLAVEVVLWLVAALCALVGTLGLLWLVAAGGSAVQEIAVGLTLLTFVVALAGAGCVRLLRQLRDARPGG